MSIWWGRWRLFVCDNDRPHERGRDNERFNVKMDYTFVFT